MLNWSQFKNSFEAGKDDFVATITPYATRRGMERYSWSVSRQVDPDQFRDIAEHDDLPSDPAKRRVAYQDIHDQLANPVGGDARTLRRAQIAAESMINRQVEGRDRWTGRSSA